MSASVRRRLSTTLVLVLANLPLAAQCDLSWLPGAPAGGPSGLVKALLRTPGGELIAGGLFTLADAAVANNVARWDGAAWRTLGSGTTGEVACLAQLPNGRIVAGGFFNAAGGQPANNIAAWDGSNWAPLGTGLNGHVQALLVMPNGDLIAGGSFLTAGGQTVARIARWNGIAWAPLGAGFSAGGVQALSLAPNGDLIAGGTLSISTTFGPLASWNGSTWTMVPGFAAFGGSITALTRRANGEVVCAGTISLPTASTNLAVWDGSTVQPLFAPFVGSVGALFTATNGDVIAGTIGTTAPTVASFNGAVWTPIQNAPSRVAAFAEDSAGNLVAGSTPSNNESLPSVHRYNGVSWLPLGAPRPPLVTTMVRMPNGDVVVGGTFASFAGIAANNLAHWNGAAWRPLGLGVDGPVAALAAAPNGDLIVGGTFTTAGGAPAQNIARFDGQTWSTLGAGPLVQVRLLTVAQNGEVLAVSGSQLLRFSGAAWSPVIVPGTAIYHSLAALPNGDISLGGVFINLPGLPGLTSLLLDQNGNVVPFPGSPPNLAFRQLVTSDGALIVRSNSLWRFDGTNWTQLPSPGVIANGLGELPNGELIACGPYATIGGGLSAAYRFRNGAWETLGEIFGSGLAIVASGSGDVFVAGPILTASGRVSAGFAQAEPTCRAAVTNFGAGCAGSVGPVTLQADNLPWAGGIYRATAMGMPAGSLALQAFGVMPTIQALPGGAAGCSVFVVPFVTSLVSTTAGLAMAEFALPNAPSLFGQQLRQQVFGIELAMAGSVQLTSTNALDLTIGGL